MSAAAGRLFRIVWIALVAALGVTAAWPDAPGADNGAAYQSRAFARELQGAVHETLPVPPVSEPVVQYGWLLDASPQAVAPAPSSAVRDNETTALHDTAASHDPKPSPQPEIAAEPDSGRTPESFTEPESAPSPQIPQPSDPPQDQPVSYVVTAYYLNVRAEPDKHSPIRDLLKQGDPVQVVGKTENGWLALEDGTYIHGAYAEPADPEPEQVKNAAREVVIASASPSVRAEHAIYKPEPSDDSAGPAPLTKKVKSSSGMTEQDIAKLLEGTALEGHGLEKAILEIEIEHGINALFTIAVMKLESGNGKSKLAREKNNLFGLNATGGSSKKAYSFETKSDSVYKFGSLIAKSYIAKGYSTIEKVGKKYCPANPKWASLVVSIMKRDHRKLSKAV